jgi:3-oxoacyl-(acyl-carrier-protein) synthase/acyl carrier protein/NADP-dependent 3-hydroxy acid dehydrogenase YdfG
MENNKITGKVIQLYPSSQSKKQENINIVFEECSSFDENYYVRYQVNGLREVKLLNNLLELNTIKTNPYIMSNKVYWFTGGLGGLGQIFIPHLAKVKNTKIIVSGRSQLSKEIENKIDDLSRGHDIEISYLKCDVSILEDVQNTFSKIKEIYGALNGIIHSSGLLQDSLIQNKNRIQIEKVFKPKIYGIVNLDEVTKSEPLDFMILFSSIAGIIGNIGQADYCVANSFLDEFAEFRNKMLEKQERHGFTLSINWPLWKDGGMQIDSQTQKWHAAKTGISILSSQSGLEIFDAIVANKIKGQLFVATGDKELIKRYIGSQLAAENKTEIGNKIENKYNEIINICSELLKIKKEDLDLDTDFSEYGLDSILMMHLLNKLESKYSTPIDPSTIIDHRNIRDLTEHLMKENIISKNSSFKDFIEKREGYEQQNSNSYIHTEIPKQRKLFKKRIAIISQSCRLPKSSNVEEFWENLVSEKDLISDVPNNRWTKNQNNGFEKDLSNKNYIFKGGFLEDIYSFDADYFGISEDEARAMDPQQRIMLELSQELFDSCNYSRSYVNNKKINIYIGAKENNYIRNNYFQIPSTSLKHIIVNSIGNMISARISDFFNLKGEAKTIDTACSSSLVAVHDACTSILNGECEMAIAGGIFLIVDPFAHIGFNHAKVLSPEGKSFVFDERANGFVLAEGAGMVLLKDYDLAIQDGDEILGEILGSAVNNDGKTMGITVPNIEGQKSVIEEALFKSQVDPRQISYLETHGTGTLLGDPIEIKSATEVYRKYTKDRQYCPIGSVKSNVGHTMTAAGITSLIKVLLCMKHKKIPATLNCSKPHPRFKFGESPFYPNLHLNNWETKESQNRIAAISSFGFGGTNCHMILSEVQK